MKQKEAGLRTGSVPRRDEAIETLTASLTSLRYDVDHLEHVRKTGLWFAAHESVLHELKSVVDSPINREYRR